MDRSIPIKFTRVGCQRFLRVSSQLLRRSNNVVHDLLVDVDQLFYANKSILFEELTVQEHAR